MKKMFYKSWQGHKTCQIDCPVGQGYMSVFGRSARAAKKKAVKALRD